MPLEMLGLLFNVVAVGAVIGICQATLFVLDTLEQRSVGYRDVLISTLVAAICLAIGNVQWLVLVPVVPAFAAINSLRVALSRAVHDAETSETSSRCEYVLTKQD